MTQPDDASRRRFLKSSSMLGLAAAFTPGSIGGAFADSKSKTTQAEETMTQTSAIQPATGQAADQTAIRPFHFEAPQADLTDLRKRVTATKWPEREQVPDASQGVQLATMQKLAQYWATDHASR